MPGIFLTCAEVVSFQLDIPRDQPTSSDSEQSDTCSFASLSALQELDDPPSNLSSSLNISLQLQPTPIHMGLSQVSYAAHMPSTCSRC